MLFKKNPFLNLLMLIVFGVVTSANAFNDSKSLEIIHACDENKSTDIIIKLIEDSKINPNIKDVDGKTPLTAAIRKKHTVVTTKLLKHPLTNPNLKGFNGKTPLIMAIDNHDGFITITLLEHHLTDPNLKDVDGETPLMRTCRNCFPLAKRLLMHHLIDPNLKGDDENEAPIHILCTAVCIPHSKNSEARSDTLQMLLEHPLTDPDLCNKNAENALYYAIKQNNSDTTALLLKNGASPFIPSYKKIMNLAQSSNNTTIITLMQDYINWYQGKRSKVGDPVKLFYKLNSKSPNAALIKLLRSYINFSLSNKNPINPALKNLYMIYEQSKHNCNTQEHYANNLKLIFPDDKQRNNFEKEIQRFTSLTSCEDYDLMFKYL